MSQEEQGRPTAEKEPKNQERQSQHFRKDRKLLPWRKEKIAELPKATTRNAVPLLLFALVLFIVSCLLWYWRAVVWRWITTALSWTAGLFDGWTRAEWFEFLPILVTFFGFGGVIAGLWQKNRVDNRTEWWKRYIWVHELRRSDSYDDRWLANEHLKVLLEGDLVTSSEEKLLGMLGREVVEDNEPFARELAEELKKSDLANRGATGKNKGIGGKDEFKK